MPGGRLAVRPPRPPSPPSGVAGGGLDGCAGWRNGGSRPRGDGRGDEGNGFGSPSARLRTRRWGRRQAPALWRRWGRRQAPALWRRWAEGKLRPYGGGGQEASSGPTEFAFGVAVGGLDGCGGWRKRGSGSRGRRQYGLRTAFAARRRLLGNGSLRFGRDDREGAVCGVRSRRVSAVRGGATGRRHAPALRAEDSLRCAKASIGERVPPLRSGRQGRRGVVSLSKRWV